MKTQILAILFLGFAPMVAQASFCQNFLEGDAELKHVQRVLHEYRNPQRVKVQWGKTEIDSFLTPSLYPFIDVYKKFAHFVLEHSIGEDHDKSAAAMDLLRNLLQVTREELTYHQFWALTLQTTAVNDSPTHKYAHQSLLRNLMFDYGSVLALPVWEKFEIRSWLETMGSTVVPIGVTLRHLDFDGTPAWRALSFVEHDVIHLREYIMYGHLDTHLSQHHDHFRTLVESQKKRRAYFNGWYDRYRQWILNHRDSEAMLEVAYLFHHEVFSAQFVSDPVHNLKVLELNPGGALQLFLRSPESRESLKKIGAERLAQGFYETLAFWQRLIAQAKKQGVDVSYPEIELDELAPTHYKSILFPLSEL